MNSFVERIKRIELQISSEHGPFELFALFRPDTALRLWDVLVSAKWMVKSDLESMPIIARQMNSAFSAHEIIQFSGIVVIPADYEGLRQFQSVVKIEHGLKEFRNVTFFDMSILHAYVITSRHTEARQASVEN